VEDEVAADVVLGITTQSLGAVEPAGDVVPALHVVNAYPSEEYVPAGVMTQDGPNG
jgi:hypothetical protein